MTRRVKIKRRPWHKRHFSLVKKSTLNRVKPRHFLRGFLLVEPTVTGEDAGEFKENKSLQGNLALSTKLQQMMLESYMSLQLGRSTIDAESLHTNFIFWVIKLHACKMFEGLAVSASLNVLGLC